MSTKTSFRYFIHKNQIFRQDTILTSGGSYVVTGPAILYKTCTNEKEALKFFNSLLSKTKVMKRSN